MCIRDSPGPATQKAGSGVGGSPTLERTDATASTGSGGGGGAGGTTLTPGGNGAAGIVLFRY